MPKSLISFLRITYPRFNQIWKILSRLFGLDKRSIALFRFLLGVVMIGDLMDRMVDLRAHYTDVGVHTRSDVMEHYNSDFFVIVHAINGGYYFQLLLFLFHMLVSLAFAIGYKTNITGIINWILLSSLHVYSPYVGHSGDVYLRVVAFWAMFLPCGEFWSIDYILNEMNDNKKKKKEKFGEDKYIIFNSATLGLYAHVYCCYVSSAYHKNGEDWNVNGNAVFYSLHLDYFQTSIARLFLTLPHEILKLFSFGTLVFENYGPLLFTSPIFTQQLRFLGAIGFIFMHLTFGICLRLGLFLYSPILTFTVFFPSLFWDKLYEYIKSKEQFEVYYNRMSLYSKFLAITFAHIFLIPNAKVLPIKQNDSETQKNNGSNSNDNTSKELNTNEDQKKKRK